MSLSNLPTDRKKLYDDYDVQNKDISAENLHNIAQKMFVKYFG